MRRIEGPPVGGISESMQKRGRKGAPVLKDQNIKLAREAEEKGFIQKLPIRQQEVIGRRYPEDGKPGSLSVIGDDLNLTRERVRQLETQAFKNIQRLKEDKPLLLRSGSTRTDIDVDEVVRLYDEEEKTYEEIATQLDCSISTVKRRLDKTGVQIRHSGARRKEVNINLLAWPYIAEEMSADEIAEPLGISRSTVLHRLREAGVKTRPGGRAKLDLDLSLIRRLYVDDNKSLDEISEIMHVSNQTISNRLKSSGVTVRRSGSRKK